VSGQRDDEDKSSLQIVFEDEYLRVAEYNDMLATNGYQTHAPGAPVVRGSWQHLVLSAFGSLGRGLRTETRCTRCGERIHVMLHVP
jgi:hypothetical protein